MNDALTQAAKMVIVSEMKLFLYRRLGIPSKVDGVETMLLFEEALLKERMDAWRRVANGETKEHLATHIARGAQLAGLLVGSVWWELFSEEVSDRLDEFLAGFRANKLIDACFG